MQSIDMYFLYKNLLYALSMKKEFQLFKRENVCISCLDNWGFTVYDLKDAIRFKEIGVNLEISWLSYIQVYDAKSSHIYILFRHLYIVSSFLIEKVVSSFVVIAWYQISLKYPKQNLKGKLGRCGVGIGIAISLSLLPILYFHHVLFPLQFTEK